jgi:translation initiation factor IF-2
LSTRVHVLAKDLGMTSQELLDRIQRAGLDVKLNPLTGLDAEMVDRIRSVATATQAAAPASAAAKQQPAMIKPPPLTSKASSPAPTAPAAAKPAPAPRPEPPAPAPAPEQKKAAAEEKVAAEPTATTPAAPAVAKPAQAPAPTASIPTPPKNPPSTPTVPSTPTAAPRTAVSSTPEAPPAPRPESAPPERPAPAAPAAQHPAPAAPAAESGHAAAPASPPARPQHDHGRGAGPLAGHTPSHRPGTPSHRPGGGHGPGGSAPIRRSDYLSPTGTRPGSGPGGMAGGPNAPRRPEGPGGPPAGRAPNGGGSGGPSRPLPTVASAAPPPLRRDGGPRPMSPEARTQRPDQKYTPEQLRQMMQSGQLSPGVQQRPPQGGPGGPRPGGPGRGPGGPGGPGGPRPPHPGGPRPGGPGRGPGGPGAPLSGFRPGGLAPSPAGPSSTPAPTRRNLPSGTGKDDEDDRNKNRGNRLGSAGERASRRARRTERAAERKITSPVSTSTILGDSDDEKRGRVVRKHKGRPLSGGSMRKTHAEIDLPITLGSLSEATGVKVNELMRKLMNMTGAMVGRNDNLDIETATMVSLEFGIELEIAGEPELIDELDDLWDDLDEPERLVPRPAIITILGHVDHGKTSLLDRISGRNVVASESGGITQHIGAFQAEHEGRMLSFVDTPGHEAFTAMRARGANVTDIAVLVVAGDDGVMPQTEEAISHAKAAGVPIVVALNKADLPGVNVDKIFGELSKLEVTPEPWGGDVPVVKTSALTGLGIDDLLATLQLVADLHELKADPDRPACGTCLEASQSGDKGVACNLIVQKGTLRLGDIVLCGSGYGRVRAMLDSRGKPIEEAPPSTPVAIYGLDEVPTAGEHFYVLDDISDAREVAETRREITRDESRVDRPAVTMEGMLSLMTQQKVESFNIILKADVQGSLEALSKEISKLENPEIPIKVLHKAVGGISESDVILADASRAVIVGFRVAPDDRAISLAEAKEVEIRRYDIIYQIIDEIKRAMEDRLAPEKKEVHLGRAAVRQVFRITKVGAVAGCFVTSGIIERNSRVRLIREGREIFNGAIDALKRFKDDVRDVREGFECGIKIANYDDVKVDDIIEAYRVDVIRRTL